MRSIDHFMYAGPDLDALVAGFSSLSGIAAQPGGSHPTLGTRNCLVGSDTPTYLELIAPDPALDVQSAMRTGIESLARGQLHRLIMLCEARDFPALAEAYRDEGIDAPVFDLQRRTPAGETLRWKLMIPAVNPLGLFAPFFIDWQDTPHPSTVLPAAFGALGCEAGHPEHPRVQRLWRKLGVDIPLVMSDAPYMRVLMRTPKGEIALTSSG